MSKLDTKMENGVTINPGSELKQNCRATKLNYIGATELRCAVKIILARKHKAADRRY